MAFHGKVLKLKRQFNLGRRGGRTSNRSTTICVLKRDPDFISLNVRLFNGENWGVGVKLQK